MIGVKSQNLLQSRKILPYINLRLQIPRYRDLSTLTHPIFKAHSLFFNTLVEGLRRIFPSLGSRKKILNSPCLLISLINIRNKKMKSWTHPVPPVLE